MENFITRLQKLSGLTETTIIPNKFDFLKSITNESYKDDSKTKGAKITDPDFELDVGKFAIEQGQLVATFPIRHNYLVSEIRNYTKDSSLNKSLINNKKLSNKDQKIYDALMDLKKLKYKLKEEHHVYSGLGKFDPTDMISDGTFQTPAFLSASLNIEVAAKNNNFHRKNSKVDHIFHMILPKGYSGCFYIGPYANYPEELEMIIFPNEKFKIIGSKTFDLDGFTRIIHTLKPV